MCVPTSFLRFVAAMGSRLFMTSTQVVFICPPSCRTSSRLGLLVTQSSVQSHAFSCTCASVPAHLLATWFVGTTFNIWSFRRKWQVASLPCSLEDHCDAFNLTDGRFGRCFWDKGNYCHREHVKPGRLSLHCRQDSKTLGEADLIALALPHLRAKNLAGTEEAEGTPKCGVTS